MAARSKAQQYGKHMKNTLGNLARVGAVGLLVAMVGVAGCKSSGSGGSRTSGQKSNDSKVAKEVMKSLSTDPTFKYSDVHANVYESHVQLTGFVETPEQRLRAAERAAQTPGVRQVINEIMIAPTPAGRVTIRDPLGHETGRVLIDTNSTVPQMRNLPSSEQEK